MPRSLESLPDIPYSDVFNAACFVQRYGEDVRYCKPLGGWFHWQGTHWKVDRLQYIMELARQTVTALGEVALQRHDKLLLSHVARSHADGALTRMLHQAMSFPAVTAEPEQFDRDPWLLNCQNGTVDLRFGLIDQTMPHRREDYITRCVPIPYIHDAPCPIWQRFLWRIMGGPGAEEEGHEQTLFERHERAARLVGFLQRAVGYALTGITDEQCLFILYGTGRNGKSRFLEACHDLLGPYAKTADMSAFLHKDKEVIRNDLADLQGVRLVSAIEASQGQRFSEGLLKHLTGGDKLKVRFLYENYFEFLPNFKLFLAFNHRPKITNNDVAIWERIHLIPFNVYIPPHERDKQLQEKLRAELPGILAWAVNGCLVWSVGEEGTASGLRPPAEVQQATEEYRADMDILGQFIAACCLVSNQGGVEAESRQLYEAYVSYAEGNIDDSADTVPMRTFGIELQKKGFKRLRANGKTTYKGIGIK